MNRIQLACFAAVTAAVLVAGVLVWKAEATPLSGSVEPLVMSKGLSAAESLMHVRHDALRRRHQMDVREGLERQRRHEEVQVQSLLGIDTLIRD